MKNYLIFDVGGTFIKYALMLEDGTMAERSKVPSPKESFLKFREEICRIYQTVSEKYQIDGVSLSMPGAFNDNTGKIDGWSNLPYLHGPNVRQELENSLGHRVYIENDANCGALGELWRGKGKGVNNFVYLVLGTGIGGGVVIDGKLKKGRTNQCGEFGYMVLETDWRNKPVVGIGECASTLGLVKDVAARMHISPKEIDGETIFRKAQENDEICKAAVERFFDLNALLILNVQFALDPDKIIISGAVASQESYLPSVLERMEELRKKNISFRVAPNVEVSDMSKDSNLYGALYLLLCGEEKRGTLHYEYR